MARYAGVSQRLTDIERRMILRLSWPVAVEQALSILTGMAFMMITGRISPGSLAAAGMVNTIIIVMQAALTALSTGAAVLAARLTGERADGELRGVAEQSFFLTLLLGCGLSALCAVFSASLLRVLMPAADDVMFSDTLRLLRIVAASFPGMMAYSVFTGILRGAGDMRSPMLISFLGNGVQLLLGWLFIGRAGMGLAGAGIAVVAARTISGVASVVPLMCTRSRLPVRLRWALKPLPSVILRILHLGLPSSLEQIAVQLGYLAQGALVFSIGTAASTAYYAAFSVNALIALPATVLVMVLTALVGRHLGAQEHDEARLVSRRIMYTGSAVTFTVAFALALAGVPISSFYTASASAAAESARLIWILVACSIPMLVLNCMISTLRAAGDVRFVMWVNIIGSWCFRVPLTWLFLRYTKLGAAGSFYAMLIDFIFRSSVLYIRYRSDKWLHIRV